MGGGRGVGLQRREVPEKIPKSLWQSAFLAVTDRVAFSQSENSFRFYYMHSDLSLWKYIISLLKYFLYIFVHVCVCHMQEWSSEDNWWGSLFFPSTLWVLGNELRL